MSIPLDTVVHPSSALQGRADLHPDLDPPNANPGGYASMACIVCKVHAFRFAVPSAHVEHLCLFTGLDLDQTGPSMVCLDPLLEAKQDRLLQAQPQAVDRTRMTAWLGGYKKPVWLSLKVKDKTPTGDNLPVRPGPGETGMPLQSCRLLLDQNEALELWENQVVFPLPALLGLHQIPAGLFLGCIVDTDGLPCPVVNTEILCTTPWLCRSKESI